MSDPLLSKYTIVDENGVVVNMDIFVESYNQSGWQKAFSKTVAEYINCSGDKSSKFLAWLISQKDGNNFVHGTLAEMASKSEVSLSAVKRVMKTLNDKKMIKRVRSGTYMITPHMMRAGGKGRGAALIRIWDDAK